MILYNRLSFFNKYGSLMNFDKVYSVECIVNRNSPETANTLNAHIEVITNEFGGVEGFDIIEPGRGYTDDVTITLSDKFTGTEYTIDVPAYIKKNSEGGIVFVEMPQTIWGFSFPSYIYSGAMLFDKVSVGLTEVEQIYIMEEVVNDTNDTITYTAPYTHTDSCNITCDKLYASWADASDDPDYEIGLFNINYDEGLEYPYLEDIENVTIELKNDAYDNGKVSNTLIRHVNINSSTATTLNVKLWSDEEGAYKRDLIIYEEIQGNKYIYALITFDGETEGEDERFRLELSNFAIDINKEEQKIFRTSSIKEEMPDYSLLNAKRKEMLLEYQNIFPYIGSYKSLVNILNYFGYGDCKLKEYWKNVSKTAKISSINKNVQAIDLTSLHMYSKFKRNGSNASQLVNIKPAEYKPKFSQNNMDIYDNDVTDIQYMQNGVVVGKKIKDVGNLVKPIPASNLNFKINFKKASTKVKDIWYEKVLSEVDEYETQYTQVEVPLQLANKQRDEENISMLPRGSWVKDNKLALFYPIIETTDEFDDEGLPITQDAFMMSEDEAAIKLFALQKYLQKKFMPLGVNIIDIVGEGVYYTRSATKTWNDKMTYLNVIREDSFDFDIVNESNLIRDLQDYGTTEELPSLSDTIASIRKRYPNNFGQKHIDFKNDSGTGVSFNKDKTVYDFGETGCKIRLDVKDIWTTWDMMDTSWDNLKNTNWKEIHTRGYTDIIWKIKYKGSDRHFYWETEGTIDTFSSVECILPYTGKYDIQCTLYDLSVVPVSKTVEYTVEMPYANFFIFGRNFMNPVLTWDENKDATWDLMQCQWRNPNIDNRLTWDELDGITWNEFDYLKYMNQNDPFIKNKSAKILKLSDRDRYVGKILEINRDNVVLEGCFNSPGLKEGDSVFIRNGLSIIRQNIVNAEYHKDDNRTILYFNNTSGIVSSTEILREVGGSVLLKGMLSKDTYNELNDGKFLLFRSDGSNKVSGIHITDITKENEIVKLKCDNIINVIPGEYAIIYKRRNISFADDMFDSELKTIYVGSDYKNEIIPGFTVINVTSNKTYKQRLLVERAIFSGTPRDVIGYKVKELDGDMTMMDGAENSAYWDFNANQIKVSYDEKERYDNAFEINSNDYPLSTNLLDDTQLIMDYGIKDGSFSVNVEYVGEIDGNTFIKLNDYDNELYQASPAFNVSWSSFDEEYAEIRYGTDIFKWKNLNEICWDDCRHLTWNMTEYFAAPKCGFVITKVKPNGMICFGENHTFQFNTLGDCKTEEEMMIAAEKELNESEEEFVQKFNYFYYDGKIHATAKFEGPDALNYIHYSGGVMGEMLDIDLSSVETKDLYNVLDSFKNTNVSHTYPIGNWTSWIDPYKYGLNNKYASWNTVARTYYEYSTNPVTELPGWYPALNTDGKEIKFKENPANFYDSHFNDSNALEMRYKNLEKSVNWRYEEYYKQFYDYALNSPFSWDDLIGSGKEITVPKFTTLFFVSSNSKVASKKIESYKWTLLENGNDKNEVVVSSKDNLIWTFTRPGYYDVKLEVEDVNGNVTSVYKNGVVLVL